MGRKQDKYTDPYYQDMRRNNCERNRGAYGMNDPYNNPYENYRNVPPGHGPCGGRYGMDYQMNRHVVPDERSGQRYQGDRRTPGADQNGRKGSGQSAARKSTQSGRGTVPGNRRQTVSSGNNRKNIRKKRRKRRIKFWICLSLFLILAAACAFGTWYLYENYGKKVLAPEVQVDLQTLDSPYAIMIDGSGEKVVGSKRGDEVIYPASMTKILTVWTAIEHIKDLNATVQMSYDYYDALYAADASRAGFEPGEDAVIRDLLYGAMLPSGAECCMELSIQAAGSESAFAELMNRKVQELGLTQTHFTNSTGLHDDQQYTTPHEMALILQAALKNKTFREVFTTSVYSVKPTTVHPDGFTFQSSMFKNMQSSTVINGEIKGGKTGFTQAAGYCLASMAEIDGREYIQVTAGWAENPRTSLYHVNDAYLGYNLVGRAVSDN